MPSDLGPHLSVSPLTFLVLSVLVSFAHCSIPGDLYDNYFGPLPAPEDGPEFSKNALRNKKYLPAEIGGIVGAYAVSLLFVAITLLALSKTRRQHLLADGDDDDTEISLKAPDFGGSPEFPAEAFPATGNFALRQVPNFSYKSPTRSEFGPTPYVQPPKSPALTTLPGVDPHVDQTVVAADREMAQQQLEEMYKHVMEHDDAKQRGVTLDTPVMAGQSGKPQPRKEKSKPKSLNLNSANDDKAQSRTSSFLSALRSPKKKQVRGVSISSPIMTPQSTTFPRLEDREMDPITPRQYAPAHPPPVPADQVSFRAQERQSSNRHAPLTPPDMSPESGQSIDERIGLQLPRTSQAQSFSQAPTEADPESATSEHSQAPLVGLPSSPKPGVTFGALPASPKPGARFSRPNAPSAVRTGGALPLRAYEPSMGSPSATPQTTKQTVFERKGPLSPGGGRTPYTAGAVPYSPYQPFTPCVPITPSLVTKEDRKRMKKLVPKTPTVEMVKSSEDMW